MTDRSLSIRGLWRVTRVVLAAGAALAAASCMTVQRSAGPGAVAVTPVAVTAAEAGESIWPTRFGQPGPDGRASLGIVVPVSGPVKPRSGDEKGTANGMVAELHADVTAFKARLGGGDRIFQSEGPGSFT